MSALGQKRTSVRVHRMSAPKSGRATARETVAYFSTAPPLSAQSLNPPRL
jgi:hypothetical protein